MNERPQLMEENLLSKRYFLKKDIKIGLHSARNPSHSQTLQLSTTKSQQLPIKLQNFQQPYILAQDQKQAAGSQLVISVDGLPGQKTAKSLAESVNLREIFSQEARRKISVKSEKEPKSLNKLSAFRSFHSVKNAQSLSRRIRDLEENNLMFFSESVQFSNARSKNFRKFIDEKVGTIDLLHYFERLPEMGIFSQNAHTIEANKIKIESQRFEEDMLASRLANEEVQYVLVDFLFQLDKDFKQEIFNAQQVPSDKFLISFVDKFTEIVQFATKKFLEHQQNFVSYFLIIAWRLLVGMFDKVLQNQRNMVNLKVKQAREELSDKEEYLIRKNAELEQKIAQLANEARAEKIYYKERINELLSQKNDHEVRIEYLQLKIKELSTLTNADDMIRNLDFGVTSLSKQVDKMEVEIVKNNTQQKMPANCCPEGQRRKREDDPPVRRSPDRITSRHINRSFENAMNMLFD